MEERAKKLLNCKLCGTRGKFARDNRVHRRAARMQCPHAVRVPDLALIRLAEIEIKQLSGGPLKQQWEKLAIRECRNVSRDYVCCTHSLRITMAVDIKLERTDSDLHQFDTYFLLLFACHFPLVSAVIITFVQRLFVSTGGRKMCGTAATEAAAIQRSE